MTKILTPKQRRFVAEYLVDLNGTKAAIRAGYSKKTAYSIGSENLRKPEVKEEIAKAQLNRELRTEITQDRILTELARICFFDIRTLYNPDSTLKRPYDLSDDAAAVVARLQTVKIQGNITIASNGRNNNSAVQTTKIRVFDKNSALLLAMKHVGILDGKPRELFNSEGTPQIKVNVIIGSKESKL